MNFAKFGVIVLSGLGTIERFLVGAIARALQPVEGRAPFAIGCLPRLYRRGSRVVRERSISPLPKENREPFPLAAVERDVWEATGW